MKGPSGISQEEYERAVQQALNDSVFRQKKTLGFYISMLFIAGAFISIAMHGAWSVFWSVLIFVPLLFLAILKASFWDWTEDKLKYDAEAGRLKKAVRWDYLCVFLDCAIDFAVFVLSTFAVFSLADGKMPLTSAWLCVGALAPFIRCDNYNWGNYNFWSQWAMVAITISSAFLPVTPAWGVAFRAVIALASVPLSCLWKRDEIWGKADRYFQNAKAARVMYTEPPPATPQAPMVNMLKSFFANYEFHWTELTASSAMLVAGFVWLLCLHKPLAPLAALPAVLLGVFMDSSLANPMGMSDEELAKRKLDADLVRPFIHIRALLIMGALAASSAAVMWLGKRDIHALVALSLLVTGSCSITTSMNAKANTQRIDPLIIIVYSVAFATVVALRQCGMTWCECLAPIPLVAYLMPVFRWFFPRSGLRGEARLEAIEEMPRRLAADIRTAAEKDRDAKMEKRRLRDARRVARIKKG